MDRLDGPTMLDTVGKPPFPLRRSGRLLTALHRRLPRIPAPRGIRVAPLPDDRLVHRDLHPLSVMLTGRTDGHRLGQRLGGRAAFDVVDTWVLFACATPSTGGVDRFIVPLGRRVMLRAFLRGMDTAAARRAVPAAVARRLTDPNLAADEHDRMGRLAVWASNA
jgi:hypothetical protein